MATTELIIASAVCRNWNVYVWKRHNDAINSAIDVWCEASPILVQEQGFITNRLRYVSRDLAAVIAYDAWQIKERQSTLYSEDLW